jgi:transposase-like protein
MNPLSQFCHNPACVARGKAGLGNITVHSQKEARYRCSVCGDTFAATKGTALYRLRTPTETVALVLILLCHGCPLQAIVAAFGFDERTVARWQRGAGQQCQRFHEHWVSAHPVELGHVQADELWVKVVGRRLWMALAIAVPSRLWLGGVIGAQRDEALITAVVRLIRRAARSPALLISVDGLSSYITAVRRVFRRPVYTGKPGRPRLEPEKGVLLGRVIKQYVKRRVVGVRRQIVQGSAEAVARVLEATRGGSVLNTAYIERLNATFRSALAPLVRRGRALVRTEAALTAGMYLTGCAYNFCWFHDSLRLPALSGSGRKWLERTPAMAAGLTPVRWTMVELLSYPLPPPAREREAKRRRPHRSTGIERRELPLAA